MPSPREFLLIVTPVGIALRNYLLAMYTQLAIVFAIGQNAVTTSKMYLGQAL
ncbi:hypothetical protein FTV88_0457 [Heliorestis convoluta]|uniref:Uncharacterized protein n=1 Tax=Heliorestis convoluta TaxID=356322 RepID=A0A5Q2MZJ8_9FIRM|nr:hypothetical protein FTV88_0441 [Heliorestis convoluta]QGG46636.1 hypothetical protein FTV88_0457 [Heliorestis convoluta]